MARAVIILVIEAIRKRVVGVTGRLASRSARPIPLVQASAPSATSPNMRPGTWCLVTNFSSIPERACAAAAGRVGRGFMDAPRRDCSGNGQAVLITYPACAVHG